MNLQRMRPTRRAFPNHSTRFVQCGMEPTEGLIVVKINGEGRDVSCRVIMPTEKL